MHSLLFSTQFAIVTRPGPHCITLPGMRLDCYGNFVSTQVDTCAFCGPYARVFHYKHVRMDIFPVYPEIRPNNKTELYDSGTHKNLSPPKYFEMDWIFPLKRCSYMGLTVPCPRSPEKVLTVLYGDQFIIPAKICDAMSQKWTKNTNP